MQTCKQSERAACEAGLAAGRPYRCWGGSKRRSVGLLAPSVGHDVRLALQCGADRDAAAYAFSKATLGDPS